MPTYICMVAAGRLSGEQKADIAAGITRVHSEVTGADGFFAQVIFHEINPDNYFVGGEALRDDHIFINGQIRAGRSAIDRAALLRGLHECVATAANAQASSVWVYITDLPACDMMEYGHVLPQPGHEAAWLNSLPAQDRARMQNTGRRADRSTK